MLGCLPTSKNIAFICLLVACRGVGCTSGDQRITSGSGRQNSSCKVWQWVHFTVDSSLQLSTSYFLRQGLPLNQKLTVLTRLAGQQAPGVCLPLPPKCWDIDTQRQSLAFMWVLRIQNQIPHAWAAEIFTHWASPQSYQYFLNVNNFALTLNSKQNYRRAWEIYQKFFFG